MAVFTAVDTVKVSVFGGILKQYIPTFGRAVLHTHTDSDLVVRGGGRQQVQSPDYEARSAHYTRIKPPPPGSSTVNSSPK